MGKKFKYLTKKWKLGDFLSNFTAVVLGIVITFVGSAIIQDNNTQKDVKKSLELVRSELLLNREILQDVIYRVKIEQKGAEYLMEFKGKMQEAHKDSINLYGALPFQWIQFSFIFDALEMIKASAMIQKIEDKDLTLQIIKSYDAIRSSEKSFNTFCDIKDQLKDDVGANPQIKQFNNSNEMDLRKIWEFYLKQPESETMLRQIPQIQSTYIYEKSIEVLESTIKSIEKQYDLSPIQPQEPQEIR